MIAETGAGQHGVASATAAALFGLECTVFMGEVDTKRQELNVFRMELLGAEVRPVTSGSRTLKDAVNEAMREWVATVEHTHYCLGFGHGPAPVPLHGAPAPAGGRRRGPRAVPRDPRRRRPRRRRGLHRRRLQRRRARSPASSTPPARLVGVEAAGGAAITNGIPGVLHGMHSRLLQDEAGQIQEAESISAGLDYPGLGPEHAHLAAIGRAEYSTANDAEVLEAFRLLSHTEGIIPALESAHAVAWVARSAGTDALPAGSTVLITLSGRGDKDVAQVREIFGRERRCLTSRRSSRASRDARAQAADPLPHGRHDRRLGAVPGRRGRRRRRRGRGRHPLLGPDDGRAGDPGGGAARPDAGHGARRGARRHRPGRGHRCRWPS